MHMWSVFKISIGIGAAFGLLLGVFTVSFMPRSMWWPKKKPKKKTGLVESVKDSFRNMGTEMPWE